MYSKPIIVLLWAFTIVVVLNTFAHLFGFGYHIGSSYREGQYGNQWIPFWGALFGLILDLQTCFLLYKYWKEKPIQRKSLWSIYCIWMFFMSLMILIGDGIVSQMGERTGHNGILGIWSATWILTLFIMINIVWFEHVQRFWERIVPFEDVGPQLTNIDKLSSNDLESNSSYHHRNYRIFKYIFKCLGWSSIGFLSFFSLLLTIEALWNANDVLISRPVGQRILIEMNSSNRSLLLHDSTIKMHILCKGPQNNGSTFIFEADRESFSASFFAFQDQLSINGRRSCIYDRAGYGWSDVLPILTNSYQSVFYLHELLKEISEPSPYVLIGHGYGGQLIQLYAVFYPNQISGLILLDSIPEFVDLLSLTGKPLNSDVTFADLQSYSISKKTTMDLLRVVTPFSIHRWILNSPNDYNPKDLLGYFNAGYGKSLYRHSLYFDSIGTPNLIEILDNFSSEKYLNGFGWPRLSNVNTPVLGIITNRTAGGPNPLCSSSIDLSCSIQSRLGRAYYDAMQIQTRTLSNNSTFLICNEPCSHTFIYTDRVSWIIDMILSKYADI